MKKNLVEIFGGAACGTLMLASYKLAEYGVQTGNPPLAAAGAVLASVGGAGALVSLSFMSEGVLTPAIGVVTGSLLTADAFEYAGNPIFDGDPLIKPEVKEKTLTLEERQAMTKSFKTDPALQYRI